MRLVFCVLAMFSLLFVSSCQEKLINKAKEQASKQITNSIVKAGECAGVAAVKADVDQLLKLENDESMVVKALGSSAPEGAQEEGIASEICKAAANLVLPVLLHKGVPQKWECKMSDLGGKVTGLAVMACGKIPL